MRIAVLAKAPEPGRVKTRLAAAIGPERAALLAAAFLDDTLSSAHRLGQVVLASTRLDVRPGVETWLQGDGDLGERLERLARRGAPLVIVGSDSPGMPAALVEESVAVVARGEAALVLAEDGGFALIGLPSCPIGLFAGVPWSAPETGVEMISSLQRFGLPPVIVGTWWDVDEVAALDRLTCEIPAERIPHTLAVLRHAWPAGDREA